MGPKRAKKAIKQLGSDEEYAPKKEESKEKVVQTIPDIPRYVHNNPREFKGRLGYACINTYLRKQKPSVFSARTCRLDTILKKGEEHVRELAFLNIADLKTMIQWNEDHHIKFLRISSDMFPFASHEKAGYEIDFAKEELAGVGELAKKYNHRLTMHPGQYNQLVSLNPKVVANTIRELHYHAHMLDLMGLDQDAVMIIHMGGVYGDREAALARFEKEYVKLPENIKRRLVLENDEMGYSVSDLLPICTKLGVPLVLDWHHHHINPGNVTDLISLLPQINKIWTDRGIKPKQHYSESRKGAVSMMELRAHSDRVQALPPTTDDVDLMIEAKDKEQAVFHLYKLFDLYPVDDEVWMPADENETIKTKGRKSVKSKKKEEAADEMKMEEDGLTETKSRKSVKSKKKAEETVDEVKAEDSTEAKARKSVKSNKRRAAEEGEDIKIEMELDSVEIEKVTKRSRKKAPATKKEKVENEITEPPAISAALPSSVVGGGRATRQRAKKTQF